MYKLFYGLAEAPFNLTPDSRFLYMSRRHNEALTALLYGVTERKGFICLTGEIGSGKTTTLRALLSRLDEEKYSVATILNSYLTDLELLKTINEEFGLSGESNSKKALLDELNAFLVREYQLGRNCVLILDESQNLRPDTLEQIRMISNLETEKDKLIQIVMVGQPELRRTLDLPELEQLNQRITVRYHVGPLDEDEVPAYIHHRLQVAKVQEQIEFTPQAYRLIYHYSKGIPRRINVICDRCLLVGYVLARFDIDGDMVQQAVDEIRGVSEPKRPEVAAIQETDTIKRRGPFTRQALLMALAAIGVIALGFAAGASFRGWTRSSSGDGSENVAQATVPGAEAAIDTPAVMPQSASTDPWDETPSMDPSAENPAEFPDESVLAEDVPLAEDFPPQSTSPVQPGEESDSIDPEEVFGDESSLDDVPISTTESAVLDDPQSVAVVEAPPAWTADEHGVLRIDQAELALPASYLQMLHEWGIEVELEPFSEAPPEEVALYDMPAMVGQLDFRAYTTEELNSALKLNLPIIIKHGPGVIDSAPAATVIQRNMDRISVADPKQGILEFELSDLEGRVVEATVLYHDPHGLTGLKSGDSGPAVETLQRTLNSLGAMEGKIDGKFGPQVRQAVRTFQKSEGLKVTGRVDDATAAALCIRIDPNHPRLTS